MGLQCELNDVSSDSLPFYLLAIVASLFCRLRSFVLSIIPKSIISVAVTDLLSVAAEAVFSDDEVEEEEEKEKCVFCLSGLREGDRVRKLTCRHVFHTHCLDGWIGQMKFSCPLCRSPLASEWRVGRIHQRVGSYISSWFAVR
ncbi:hypothetical protein RND81_02G189400 [Saponaria officinalis]|uniref:RING-type domain-containing protein n=1 Tax=Saponaria officinalis TaxID=3572 RepID=A0AAW1MVK7_SAPOF